MFHLSVKLYIFGVILFSHMCSMQVISERDAVEKTDRYAIFHLLQATSNHLLTTGQCCGRVINEECSGCDNTVLYFKRTNVDGAEKNIKICSFSSLPSSKAEYKVAPLMTSQHKSIRIVHFNRDPVDDGSLMDEWNEFDTKLIGLYSLNDVWGNYGNTRISISLELRLTREFKSYANINYQINRLGWKNKTYTDGSYCNSLSNSTHAYSCQFYMKSHIGNLTLWTTSKSNFSTTDNKLYLNWKGGSVHPNILKDYLTFTIDVLGTTNDKLIDTINVKLLRLIPNKMFYIETLTGDYNKLTIDLVLTYECLGYSGYNCQFFCHENSSIVGCRFDNGAKFCMNGATDVPTCKRVNNTCEISPCVNGGKCIRLKKGNACDCPKTFVGAYCEYPNCLNSCKNGTCNGNTCVCNPGYEGDICDTVSCTAEESLMCKNGGNCKKDGTRIYCVCPSNTKGDYCEEPVCSSECNSGDCVMDKIGNLYVAKCVCRGAYNGDDCTQQKLVIDIGDQLVYPIIVSILVTAILLTLKAIFLTFIFKDIETTEVHNDLNKNLQRQSLDV